MKTNNDIICDEQGVCKISNTVTPTQNKEENSSQKTIQVTYGYDALCGWCYGFSNNLSKAIDSLNTKIEFKIINGGIFAAEKGLKMKYIKQHIQQNAPNVTRLSGVEFGKNFMTLLENDEYLYDSKKASIAVLIIREMKPEKVFDFASAIQKAFFYYGKDIQNDAVYLDLIKDYNIDETLFLHNLNSEIYSRKIEQEFIEASKLGFQGYPASAITINGKTQVLNQGYMSEENFITAILDKIN